MKKGFFQQYRLQFFQRPRLLISDIIGSCPQLQGDFVGFQALDIDHFEESDLGGRKLGYLPEDAVKYILQDQTRLDKVLGKLHDAGDLMLLSGLHLLVFTIIETPVPHNGEEKGLGFLYRSRPKALPLLPEGGKGFLGLVLGFRLVPYQFVAEVIQTGVIKLKQGFHCCFISIRYQVQ